MAFRRMEQSKKSHGLGQRQCREQLALGRHDAENDYPDKWQQPQKKNEGRGWADMKATTSDNTYTGKGGSKRD